jgi:O-antigen ligase
MSSMNKATDANNFVPLTILLLGLTPVIMVLLPWDFGRDMTPYRGFMRGNSLPVTLIEFILVLLAMARGFSAAAAIVALPGLTKAGLLLFSVTSVWTTIFVAEFPIVAALGMAKLFAHLMFGLAIAHQMKGWSRGQRNYVWPAIGIGVLWFCLLWAINIFAYDAHGDDWIWLVPTLTNVRWVGFFALASFCAGIGFLGAAADDRRTGYSYLPAVFFGTMGLTIALWTGSRGALVAIIVAAVLSSLVSGIWQRLAIYTLISAALGIAITVSLPVVHPEYGIDRIIGSSNPSGGAASISSGRLQLWADTIDKIWHRPIAGWGIDQFRYSFDAESAGLRHPHESILQLLFSNGLLGAVALIIAAIPLASHFPRKVDLPYQQAALAYLFGASAYGLYDGFFYYTYPMMTMLVAVACISVPTRLNASDRSD